jgi:hypothetical protein
VAATGFETEACWVISMRQVPRGSGGKSVSSAVNTVEFHAPQNGFRVPAFSRALPLDIAAAARPDRFARVVARPALARR